MLTFVSIVHVALCVFMIFVILLQPGKDAGMGAALGGGAATSAFGGRGAVTFLTKLTAVCATGFFLTSLGLSFVGLKTSVAAGEEPPATTSPAEVPPVPPTLGNPPANEAPAAPAAPAPEAAPTPAPSAPPEVPAAPSNP